MPSYTKIGESWRATIRVAGHPQKSKTFPLLKDAKTWAVGLETELRSSPKITGKYRVSDLIKDYKNLKEEVGREVVKGSNLDFMLRHLEVGFGTKDPMKLVSQDYINWVREGIRNGRGKNALGQELTILKAVYNSARGSLRYKVPDELGDALQYMIKIGLVKTKSNHRTRTLSEAEIEHKYPKLLAALPSDEMRDIVSLAMILGLRRSEILGLKWVDYDETEKMIWVRNRKHPREKKGNDDHIPLILGADDIIKRQPRTHERIFPTYSKENVSDWFLKACKAAELTDFRFHDLRHISTTELFKRGLEIPFVALISGHKDWKHLKRYTNPDPKALHELIK